MIKTEAKRPVGAFDYEASDKFEEAVEKLIDIYEKDGRLREGLKGFANILMRKLRSADRKSIAHSYALERIMRGVSMAIDHPEDQYYIVSNIKHGVDFLKNRVPEDVPDEE